MHCYHICLVCLLFISVYYVLWYNLGIHEREYLCMKMNIYAICIQCIFMQSDEYLCTGTRTLFLEIFRYEITTTYNSKKFMNLLCPLLCSEHEHVPKMCVFQKWRENEIWAGLLSKILTPFK